MLNFLIRRLFYMLITLIFISFIAFIIVELPEGSYLDVRLERARGRGDVKGQGFVRVAGQIGLQVHQQPLDAAILPARQVAGLCR